VPVRIEIGPKDIEKAQVVVARRDTREKSPLPMANLAAAVTDLLDEIQRALLERARKFRDDHTTRVATYDEFKSAMEGRPGFLIAGWCGSGECEATIKAETQATLRNIPFASDPSTGSGSSGAPSRDERVSGTCVKCGKPAGSEAWFAKAY
jgi:prolyl-tRNA synthetase